MAEALPFMNSTGLISKIFEKIIDAQTPSRYSQDFQSTKLGYGSGSAKPFLPLLKRIGFLESDGTPTELYKEFRNESLRGQAMAKAIKKGYAPLYTINEYAHELDGQKLKDVIIQVTGHDKNSSTVKGIAGTFKALQAYADFDTANDDNLEEEPVIQPKKTTVPVELPSHVSNNPTSNSRGMSLSYTINLNLPETKDPEVFNAIFKSLKENLLD